MDLDVRGLGGPVDCIVFPGVGSENDSTSGLNSVVGEVDVLDGEIGGEGTSGLEFQWTSLVGPETVRELQHDLGGVLVVHLADHSLLSGAQGGNELDGTHGGDGDSGNNIIDVLDGEELAGLRLADVCDGVFATIWRLVRIRMVFCG